jgi:hypothetical protein
MEYSVGADSEVCLKKFGAEPGCLLKGGQGVLGPKEP